MCIPPASGISQVTQPLLAYAPRHCRFHSAALRRKLGRHDTHRHCAACAKTVVDFTLKSDAEILAYLAQAAGARTCGRFAAGQLERPLQRAVSAAPTARWRAWLAAILAVWGLRETASIAVKAQAPMEDMRKMGKPVLLPEQLRASRKPDYEGANETRVLRGVVLDSTTHEALPGVSLIIKNSTIGASSDAEGNFELTIPAEYAASGIVEIQVQYLGYVTETHRVSIGAGSQPAQRFLLQTDVKGLSEVIMAGGLTVSRTVFAPWHPRSLYYWGKYWLTRPFHRS